MTLKGGRHKLQPPSYLKKNMLSSRPHVWPTSIFAQFMMSCTDPSSLSQTPNPQTLYIYSLSHTHSHLAEVSRERHPHGLGEQASPHWERNIIYSAPRWQCLCVCSGEKRRSAWSQRPCLNTPYPEVDQKMFRHLIGTITQILLGAEPLIWVQSQL